MMFMSQNGELKLPRVTQRPEVRGRDRRRPDSGICVLGPEAKVLGLPTTLEPAKGGPWGAGGRVQLPGAGAPEGGSEAAPFLGRLPWSAQTGAGEGLAWEGPGPALFRGPHEPRGPASPSDEACGGPAGDLGAPPEARLQAEMALEVGLRLPVCPSEPVIHALGQGSNQL